MSVSTAAAAAGTGAYDRALLESFEASLRLPANHAPITPISSPEDKRQYRVITLDNGLTAMLVSDPETDKAAASLDVNIGSFAEPGHALGLAHFLEHMLFMGTSKYPDENEYSQVINNHGGSQNAYTTREHTNYIFDVSKDHLRDVLDRFAQFFVAPLCLKSAVDRELNAVNNENEKNLQHDGWRIAQLSESTLNPDHPISRFSTGNNVTLRDAPQAAGYDIREELLKFYFASYSSNLMKLCVVGQESLDQLQQWVEESFRDVKNIGRARPSFLDIPLAVPGVHTQTLTRIVPVKNYRMMEVEWIFPPTHQHYLADPSKLIVHCLAHEGEGSLAHYLKARSLVNSLTAGALEPNSSYSLGRIEMELTEAGLLAIDDILEAVAAYTHMLKASLDTHPAEWRESIYREVRAVERMDFRFAEKIDPVWFCENQAARLSYLPPQHVLSGGCLETYDEAVLRQMAAIYADSSALRVRVVAPEWKTLDGLQTEKWYGTNYVLEPFSAGLIARMAQPRVVAAFHLPKCNPFVAEDFSLRHAPTTAKKDKSETGCQNGTPKHVRCECGLKNNKVATPAAAAAAAAASPSANGVVHAHGPSAPAAELYFLPDRSFDLPKVDVSIQISNGLSATSARNTALAHLWSDLVDDALSELNHYAEQSGIGSFSWPSPQGFCLRYTGFSHKMRHFIQAVLPKLRGVKATERVEQFDRLKEAMLRKLTAWKKETALAHARDDANALRLETHWTVDEQLAVFGGLTPIDVDRFVGEWFASGKIYAMCLGNLDEAEARALVQDVQDAFQLAAILPAEEHMNRCVDLPTEHTCLRQMPAPNAEDSNSACFNVYQIGDADETTDAIQCLISHILSDALFDQLRTKETLGYLVSGYHRKSAGILHYHIAVQSSDAAPAYLNARIEAFLQWFRDEKLADLCRETPDFLAKNKAAVVLQLTEKDKNLGDEQARFWPEVERRRFDWTRRERVAKEVEKITIEAVWAYWDRYLSAIAPTSQRKKLSVQYGAIVHARPHKIACETKESVAFGNEKLVLKKPAAAPTTTGAAAAAGGDSSAAGASEEKASDPTEDVYLPPVPVDPRPILYVDDIVAFKRSMPLHKAML